MSRFRWMHSGQLPVPLSLVKADDGDDYFMSRRVLLYYRNGECAVGWVELLGPWEAHEHRHNNVDYIGHDGAVIQWSSEDGVVHGEEPTHWHDLPPPPEVTGHAIMATNLRKPMVAARSEER